MKRIHSRKPALLGTGAFAVTTRGGRVTDFLGSLIPGLWFREGRSNAGGVAGPTPSCRLVAEARTMKVACAMTPQPKGEM